MNVIENYKAVLLNIQKHCEEIKRNPDEIKLLAVSKTQPVTEIQKLYDFGVRDFGENKVQEMEEKAAVLPSDIRWHLIGSLQTNKVKYITGFVYLIHSADRTVLIDEIERCAAKSNRTISVLLQIRVASEETKHGCPPDEADQLLDYALSKKMITVSGCMTMASFTTDTNVLNREYQTFFKHIPKRIKDNPESIYSAGMTGDYLTAISNGANLVRVGTAIFGERHYT